MMAVVSVYVVCASRAEARKIATAAVKERLAACANVLGQCESTFIWEGKLASAREVPLVMKTTRKLFPRLERLVRRMHSHEVPCIVAWPVAAGNNAYLDWVSRQLPYPKKLA